MNYCSPRAKLDWYLGSRYVAQQVPAKRACSPPEVKFLTSAIQGVATPNHSRDRVKRGKPSACSQRERALRIALITGNAFD